MSSAPSTRLSLLLRVRSSDAEAWREFEAAYSGLIIRYCRRRGVQLADAEDICQSVLAKLSRSLRAFEYRPEKGRFRDYLGRSVQNALNSFFASHTRRPALVSLDEAARAAQPGDDAPDPLWVEEWVQYHYRRAMRALDGVVDERSLQVFDALVHGQSMTEVQSRFSMTPAAVRKVKQRVKDRLREIIARQIADEDPTSRPGYPDEHR